MIENWQSQVFEQLRLILGLVMVRKQPVFSVIQRAQNFLSKEWFQVCRLLDEIISEHKLCEVELRKQFWELYLSLALCLQKQRRKLSICQILRLTYDEISQYLVIVRRDLAHIEIG